VTPEQVWATISLGRKDLARDLAQAALAGADAENVPTAAKENAAIAVAFKLWFLIWEGRGPLR
jgi:hypothetical protein